MTQELAPEEYDKVNRHLAECASCASTLTEMRNIESLLQAYERPPAPKSLHAEYSGELKKRFGRRPAWRRLLVAMQSFAAGVAASRSAGFRLARSFAILLLGVMIGRYVIMPPSSPPAITEQPGLQTPALTSADIRQLNDYFVQAEQLLLTIANTPDADVTDDDLNLNKDVAKQLLVKSTLMQRKAGVLDDESITVFLNHLEFILLEMSNRKDDQIHSEFQDIRKMVKEAGLVKKSMQLQEKMARSLATSA